MATSRVLALATLAALSLLAGCTSQLSVGADSPTPSEPPGERAAAPAPADTAALLAGTWTVTDQSDGMVGTLTLLEGGMWEAAYECGGISGEWTSVGAVFLATSWGGSMACSDGIDPQPTLAWVSNTVAITASESGWTLADESGTATATLDGGVTAVPAPRRQDISPLPSELAVGALTGRWVPLIENPGGSFLLLEEGAWTGSDGCNGSGGKWVDLGDGYLVATPQGITTQVGCENVPVATWIGEARTAGFDGDTLVLLDAEANELARFERKALAG